MQKSVLAGREKEASTRRALLTTDESELVSVIRRRRIGRKIRIDNSLTLDNPFGGIKKS